MQLSLPVKSIIRCDLILPTFCSEPLCTEPAMNHRAGYRGNSLGKLGMTSDFTEARLYTIYGYRLYIILRLNVLLYQEPILAVAIKMSLLTNSSQEKEEQHHALEFSYMVNENKSMSAIVGKADQNFVCSTAIRCSSMRNMLHVIQKRQPTRSITTGGSRHRTISKSFDLMSTPCTRQYS